MNVLKPARRRLISLLAVLGTVVAIPAGAVATAQTAPASQPADTSVATVDIPMSPTATRSGSPSMRPDDAAQIISTDPYRNPESQHETEVEADTVNWRNSVVATFQVGRNKDGGAANIGWAGSPDGGVTWWRGFLPGLTDKEGGPWPAVSDPSVAVDVKHQVWLISSLALANDSEGKKKGQGVYTSRAPAGEGFGSPIWTLGNDGQAWDKNWITCDNSPSSPYYGNCYTVANISGGKELFTSVSSDGGLTWSAPRSTADHAKGVGAQVVVLPNGVVWVGYRYFDDKTSEMRYFRSFDGGATFRASELIDYHYFYRQNTGIPVRDGLGVPSVEVDGGGRVYIVFPDCRYQPDCAGNGIVLYRSNSLAGLTPATADQPVSWDKPSEVPAPAGVSASIGNNIIPGIGADKATSGPGAKLGLFWYFVKDDFIYLAYRNSANAGDTWSDVKIVDSALPEYLPDTGQGRMVGDYLSCSVVDGGRALTAFAMADLPGSAGFTVPMYGIVGTITGGLVPTNKVPVSQTRPERSEASAATLR